MRRIVGGLVLFAPVTPVEAARPCNRCPQVIIECGACHEYVGQTC